MAADGPEGLRERFRILDGVPQPVGLHRVRVDADGQDVHARARLGRGAEGVHRDAERGRRQQPRTIIGRDVDHVLLAGVEAQPLGHEGGAAQ